MRTLIAALLLISGTAAAAERPNVLFLAVDDLRPDLGCYGADFVHTPNLDRLAASGTVFTRAYCQQAVCSPSRTSLLTGKRPDTTKVWDLDTHFRDHIPETVTLPQRFKQAGYRSVGMGKIYHGGFDDKASWSEPHVEPKSRFSWALPENQRTMRERRSAAIAKGLKGKALGRQARGPATESADVPDDAYHDGALANLAVETLGRLADRDEPFFLAVGFLKPHLPFIAPTKYWDLYDRADFAKPDNYFPPKLMPAFAGTSWGEMRAYSDIPQQGDVSAEKAAELIHGYYAAVSYMDAQVGRVLEELDRLGLAKNTIVVLWGDHGWKLGEHGMWCKHTNFELDARVPLILRAPGQPAGQTCDRLVEFVDIYPTLCDLAGVSAPADLEGSSFAPLLTNPSRAWKAAAFSQYPRGANGKALMGYTLTDGRYRFTRWVEKQHPDRVVAVELYDHETDPQENVNVADDSQHKATVARLNALADRGWRGVREELRAANR